MKLVDALAEEPAKHPGKPVEVFAKSAPQRGAAAHRVWAPVGERPITHGHHRFDWLCATALTFPPTGDCLALDKETAGR
ncbi:MAG: hypothetical protein L0Z50_03700 [Verrucomicrobiales bacterium]|nr:hypothetical protein [Verrucomicrobiales bacterium]